MNRSSNPVDELWTCWEQRRYMAALAAAWRLPSLYNYPAIISRNSDLSLQRLVFRACQQAFTTVLRSDEERQPTLLWVNELLGQFPPPPALIDHGDGSDAETYREQMIRATLTCVRLALTEHWTSPLRFSPTLSQVAEDNDLPLGLLQDCVFAWMSQSVEGSSWRQPQQSIALNALLVEETRGVVTTLTLDLLENGTGSWYPSPELAFVRRDAAFRQTEKQAWLSAGPLSARYDLRWRLRRRDGQPITALTGPSMGLVFTLGIAKLLTTDLQTVELEAVGGNRGRGRGRRVV